MASSTDQTKAGIMYALCAYIMWGIAPIYFKALSTLPAGDILMHRVLWSSVVLLGLSLGLRQIDKIVIAFRSIKVIKTLFFASILLAVNWLLFIWAVNNDKLLEASLGYYINPLFNVFLARLFLGEILRPLQKLAVLVAMSGVLIMLVSYGRLPWVALVLACSFSVYGLLRKQVDVDSLPGLFIETLMMLPFALIYWIWFMPHSGDIFQNTININVLLISAGIVTTAPLLCFTAAARRIRYSTLGFFQYIGPSLMFMLATLLYQEPLTTVRLLTFACVWLGLIIFTYDSIKAYNYERSRNKHF
ncbi:EamA family transporter RarD [Glaciecola petra]|uniref:EamA family transporter RarD n=1 Tax=Glaciecola petra TaxID=3075602 RepID=A0ABU2ZTF1_9ALTE|nr:EamA family transporter RarD [Aestuariibacter sp. P117]MDT0595686.1 EamA family transporter RarD [Aestuariibacter sp. P117]